MSLHKCEIQIIMGLLYGQDTLLCLLTGVSSGKDTEGFGI